MSVINTNVKSLVAQASLAANSKNQATAMERLSTGSRINSAKDDAAGLAISSRMTSQVRGLNMAIRNANDGISLAQTAEGALDETTSMLQRMRELSVQASNGVNNASDRAAIDSEVQQLKTEIDRIASTTKFNGQNVLDGSMNATLQIGDQVGQSMQLAVGNMATAGMGETASGLATGATKAALMVGGVSTNATDFNGKTFQVSVNGAAETVTLPVVTGSVATPATAASTSVAFSAADRVEPASSRQVGAQAERVLNVSTNRYIKLAVNDGDVGTQEVDVLQAALELGYDATSLNGDKFVASLQRAIDSSVYFTGNNAVTVGLTADGQVSLAVAGGAQKIAVSEGTGVALLTALQGSLKQDGTTSTDGSTQVKTGGFLTIGAPGPGLTANSTTEVNEIFGSAGVDITQSTGDTLSLTVGSSQQVDIDVVSATTHFDTYAALATAVQAKIDATGLLTGDNAIVVSATKNASGQEGLTFANAAGQKMVIGGTFVTHATGLNVSAETVEAIGYVDQIGTLKEQTIDLTTAASKKFTLNVNGGGDRALDMAAAITSLGLTAATMSGANFVSAMQKTIDDAGSFAGEQAVTVSIDSDGLVNLDVAGGVGSVTFKENGAVDGLAFMLTGSNHGVVAAASDSVTNGGKLVLGKTFNDAVAPPDTTPTGVISLARTGAITGTDRYQFKFVDDQGAVNQTTHATTIAAPLDIAAVATALNTDYAATKYSFAAVNGSLQITNADGRDFTVQRLNTLNVDATAATTGSSWTPAGNTALVHDGMAVSSKQQVETFGLATTRIKNTSEDQLTITVGSNPAVTVDLASADTEYTTMAGLRDLVQSKINANTGFQGSNAITVGLKTDANGATGLTFAQASGQAMTVAGNFVTGELGGSSTNILAVPQATGGIDLSAGNTLDVTISDGASSVTRTLTLGSSGSNVSLADYASLVQSSVNSAFSGDGYSVSASSTGGNFGLTLDQSGAKTISISGASVTAALGNTVTATGSDLVTPASNPLASMSDVVAAINADLSGATASFDAAAGALTFTATAGSAGANSSVSLSGSDLASLQIAGTLTASGSAGNATASNLSTIAVDTVANASAAINSIDNAIEYVNSQRSSLGAIQNRLDHTVNNLTNISLNTEASRSRIMDADYGQESAALAKAQIIQQAATAMLAQANQSSQSVLSLLQ